jgi:hypothetical protein
VILVYWGNTFHGGGGCCFLDRCIDP